MLRLDTLSTAQLVGLALLGTLVYLAYAYRDRRAIGTRPRPDLVSFDGEQTFLLGDFPMVLKHKHRMLDRLYERQLRDGHLLKEDPSRAFTMTLPGMRMVLITKPEHIAHVQKDGFANYVKGPLFRRSMHQVLGEGIFVVDGHPWQMQRKATAKIFTAGNFKGIITSSIQEHIRRLVTVIGEHADRAEDFDLAELFFRFTLDSFTEMAFGRSTRALDSTEPVPFAVAFDYAQGVMDLRFNNPLWPIMERLDGTKAKMEQAVRILDDFAYGIIAQREIEGRDGKKGTGDSDLLSLYMALRDESGEPLSRQALRDALLNLIIAGRDTTAQGLAWTMFRLIRQPELFDPIRAEVNETGEELDYETWRAMAATTATFMEGLRLHPSVPKNAWQAVKDDVMPNGGPRVEKGDFVSWNDWCRARDPDLWGPDATHFKPSRFLDKDTGHLLRPEDDIWRYHVFNGGRRLCLGMNLALFEGSAVLAGLAQEFDFAFADGYLETTPMNELDGTPMYRPSLTLPMASPLRVRATRRAAA